MLWAVVLVGCVGCTSSGWRRDAGLEIAWAATAALTACDVGGTLSATNMARYDRSAGEGYVLGEGNPILQQMPGIGSRPSATMLIAAPALVTAASYGMTGAPIPRWIRWTWFVVVAAVETYAIANNAQWSGACGVAGTSYER